MPLKIFNDHFLEPHLGHCPPRFHRTEKCSTQSATCLQLSQVAELSSPSSPTLGIHRVRSQPRALHLICPILSLLSPKYNFKNLGESTNPQEDYEKDHPNPSAFVRYRHQIISDDKHLTRWNLRGLLSPSFFQIFFSECRVTLDNLNNRDPALRCR